jgi:DNA-binding NtrC family response regulator
VLESGRFLRVGGDEEVKVDLRLIAATNRELDAAVAQGSLRSDLMYRLAVFPMRVPPLRERSVDVELLAQHFLSQLNSKNGTRKVFARRTADVLRGYAWPGNVRELKNMVLRAFILSGDSIALEEFVPAPGSRKPTEREGQLNFHVGTPLADAQREIILATLRHFDGNKRMTAETLGISLKTLYNRLKEF